MKVLMTPFGPFSHKAISGSSWVEKNYGIQAPLGLRRTMVPYTIFMRKQIEVLTYYSNHKLHTNLLTLALNLALLPS